jgi:hypothetical protein
MVVISAETKLSASVRPAQDKSPVARHSANLAGGGLGGAGGLSMGPGIGGSFG